MDVADFWERVKELIKERNTTQRGLSETIGLGSRNLELKISRKSIPDVFETYKIAQALNTTVEYLVTGKEPSAKPLLDRIRGYLCAIEDELSALENV